MAKFVFDHKKSLDHPIIKGFAKVSCHIYPFLKNYPTPGRVVGIFFTMMSGKDGNTMSRIHLKGKEERFKVVKKKTNKNKNKTKQKTKQTLRVLQTPSG